MPETITTLPQRVRERLHGAEIEFHRGLFHTPPVDLHAMPPFWWQRVCWLFGGWGRFAAEQGMQKLVRETGCDPALMDHWGRSVNEAGEPVFVTEPYLDWKAEKTQRDALKVATWLGLSVRLRPPERSWWNPTQTCRIEFSERPCTPQEPHCRSRDQFRADCRSRREIAKWY
jgi:hypothetical protein